MSGLFRKIGDSNKCDNVCGNLDECYIETNVEQGIRPEHRIPSKDIVVQDYNELLRSYWDTKIQNFSVTEQGASFHNY